MKKSETSILTTHTGSLPRSPEQQAILRAREEQRDLLPIVLKARPMGLSFEGANPRHAHEYKVWHDIQLPDGKVIIPGVLDTCTNFVEHPELVADRIVRYAEIVGRENVIAGTDCGFGTSAWGSRVDARVAWAKLAAMVEGARLASRELWGS